VTSSNCRRWRIVVSSGFGSSLSSDGDASLAVVERALGRGIREVESVLQDTDPEHGGDRHRRASAVRDNAGDHSMRSVHGIAA
jgi:hypothetical protein